MKEAAAFWDREVVAPIHTPWMAHPDVRRYVNESISGDPHQWPIDWFIREYKSPRFGLALSIGCGTGALERDLLQRGLCDRFDAFDGSAVSLEIARAEAAAMGLSERVNYWIGDFNEPELPSRKYDAVFFHQSAHHVGKLEKLYRAILGVLKPDGILYLDEYIGPSRSEWNDERLEALRKLHRRIPNGVRLNEHLPPPIQDDDPSEAIRSSEILPQLRIGFDVEQIRGYGGNVLAILFAELRDPRDELVKQMIEAERAVLARGEPPFYAIIVARPKRGGARQIARVRYFVEPKLARVGRELRRLSRRAS